MISPENLSLVAINTASGLLLGASTYLAVELLPIKEKYKWVVLGAIAVLWTVAVSVATYYLHPPQEFVARRWINVFVLLWVSGLMIWHSRKDRNKTKV